MEEGEVKKEVASLVSGAKGFRMYCGNSDLQRNHWVHMTHSAEGKNKRSGLFYLNYSLNSSSIMMVKYYLPVFVEHLLCASPFPCVIL